jgi:hypothetical protein
MGAEREFLGGIMQQERQVRIFMVAALLSTTLALAAIVAWYYRSPSPAQKSFSELLVLGAPSGTSISKEAAPEMLARAAMIERIALADYNTFVLRERQRVLEWYRTSTKVIFWMVMGITASGLAMSWWQFRVSLLPESESPPTQSTRDESEAADANGEDVASSANLASSESQLPKDMWRHEMELKAYEASLSIKTRSIAVLLMFFSLIFFGLYVKFIYPLQSTPKASSGRLPSSVATECPESANQLGWATESPPISKEQEDAARTFQ